MRVRRLEASEWEALRALRQRALADAPGAFGSVLPVEVQQAEPYWRQRARVAAEGRERVVLLAEEGGLVVGMVGGSLGLDPSLAELSSLWVAPGARGRGVGAALVRALVAWARERGARLVELWLTEENVGARRLYEREGFAMSGRGVRLPSAPPRVVRQMVLRLRPA